MDDRSSGRPDGASLHHEHRGARGELGLERGLALLGGGLALAAVGLSWSLVHTSYTLRYARLFYRKAHPEGGLVYPGTTHPSDIDFAYFSFGIGMTFQTGDVQVTASRVRRTVMFHALISFVLNTVIVALALNVMVAFLAK
mgnify:CR=1 FL=1